MEFNHYVSFSGGKDSTACLVMACERRPGRVKAIFCDTGNEHESVYEYVPMMADRLGVELITLRADFSADFVRKAAYVRDKWPEKGVPNDVVQRALSVLDKGPTGNAFLDLVIIKTRFPSTGSAFCSKELKRDPINEFFIDRIEAGENVVSWQGVRRDESQNRRNAKLFERAQRGRLYNYRPIVYWTAQQTVDYVRDRGHPLNPLYAQGMTRVGCMPCINVRKNELKEISRRFPEHIDRIEEWENLVGLASLRQNATFFTAEEAEEGRGYREGSIREAVEWSKTMRGGKTYDLFWDDGPVDVCSSAYGLCE